MADRMDKAFTQWKQRKIIIELLQFVNLVGSLTIVLMVPL